MSVNLIAEAEDRQKKEGQKKELGACDESEPYQSEDYQRHVAECEKHCECATQHCPCDGVLAGGICDGRVEEDVDELWDEDEFWEDEF